MVNLIGNFSIYFSIGKSGFSLLSTQKPVRIPTTPVVEEPVLDKGAPVSWSRGQDDSVPAVGGEAGGGGQRQEAEAAMAAAVPVIFGEGGGLGEHQ